jgi:hypothetical protein
MQKPLFRSLLVIAFLSILLTSCYKDESGAPINYGDEAATQSKDNNEFSSQIDAIVNDAYMILESNGSFAGRPSDVITGVCNASFDLDTLSNPRTITIHYSGLNCHGTHNRSGTVIISMAANSRWKDAGATITATYTDLVITRVIDNKKLTINGSHVITNISGGLLVQLPTLNSITHRVTSNGMNVKFEDASQRTWQVARQRVFTYNNGIVMTVTGLHTEGSLQNIAEWGTNRFGRTFTSSITQPLVFRQDCNARLVSGEIKHIVPVFTVVGTFGLDINGNPTNCPGNGHYYCKLVWTGPQNSTYSLLFPY